MKSDRPKQELPAEILADLLRVIRNQFCPGLPAKEWYQSRNFFLRVLTWSAAWLNKRGVTLPPARYQAILLDIFTTIKRNGQTGAVNYWPGYLLHCVQEHWKHHGDEYYEEGKTIRAQVERNLMAFQRAAQAPVASDQVATLAQIHQALQTRKPTNRQARKPAQQMDLL